MQKLACKKGLAPSIYTYFMFENDYYIVMENCDPHKILSADSRFITILSVADSELIMVNIEKLHQHDIMHGDLHKDNMMISRPNMTPGVGSELSSILFIDFGESKKISSHEPHIKYYDYVCLHNSLLELRDNYLYLIELIETKLSGALKEKKITQEQLDKMYYFPTIQSSTF